MPAPSPSPVAAEAALHAALADPQRRRAAFSEVIRLYEERIYWQIRRMVICHDDAQDVLQNTFMKAWMNLDSFRGQSKVSTWLYTIAHNESLTFLNRLSTEREMLADDPAGVLRDRVMADPYFDGDETERRFRLAIAALPPKQRQVFSLRYYDEMPYDEMSQVLDTSVGALKASYHFAVKKVEDFLQKSDIDNP